MELIIFSIALEHGILTPMLSTMTVMMTIVTTLMASSVFAYGYRCGQQHVATPIPPSAMSMLS